MYVYFALSESFVKIGTTADLTRRRIAMQTDNPHGAEILFAFPGDRRDERLLHEVFGKYHHSREWFRLEGNLADHVEHVLATLAESAVS